MSVNKVNSDGSLLRVAGGTLYADAPIGTISPFGGSSVPSGYLLCNGQAVSRATYAELFAVIGTSFGEGDESTTFNIPDLREATTKGIGENPNGESHVKTGGLSLGEFIDDRMQSHTHGVQNGYDGSNEGSAERGDARHGYSIRTNNATGRTGNTTEVKAVGVNYIIKAKQVAVPFDMAEYIRNQNVLSDYENIALSTTSKTMEYDGFISLSEVDIIRTTLGLNVNGRQVITSNAYWNSDVGGYVPLSGDYAVKKGDVVTTSRNVTARARYYKLRDYTRR